MDSEKKEFLIKCNQLPKTELHAHLNGCIRKETLIELLSDDDKKKVEKLYEKMDFDSAMAFFKIASTIMKDLVVIRRLTKELIEDWNKQNVIYLELRITLKSGDVFSKEEYLYTVLDEIKKGNEQYKMVTRLVISIDRQKPIEDYKDTFRIWSQIKDEELKRLIVGIDYCGNESVAEHKYEDAVPIFQLFRDNGLKVTIHVADCPTYLNFPYNKFVPDRISHAFFMKEEHYKEFMKLDIPIEICPTISMKVTYSDMMNIPLKNFYKKKMINSTGQEFIYDKIAICTSDTMLISGDISQEYFDLASAFNLTIKDLKDILIQGIDFIFETNKDVRQKLKQEILNFSS